MSILSTFIVSKRVLINTFVDGSLWSIAAPGAANSVPC